MGSKIKNLLASFTFAGITMFYAPDAPAASLICDVGGVAWSQDIGGLQIWCGNTGYYALSTVNIDVRKAWLSLAQAAYLSGKPLYIEYSTTGNQLAYVRLGP
jgi:hypothetical protein